MIRLRSSLGLETESLDKNKINWGRHLVRPFILSLVMVSIVFAPALVYSQEANETEDDVSQTDVVNKIFDNSLPAVFIIVIFLALIIPMIFDMYLAYRRKPGNIEESGEKRVRGMPGLYRTLMAFGIMLLVGTVIFYLLALITLNLNNLENTVLESLIAILRDLGIILGTGLATIIAFYFGQRGSESSVEKAASMVTSNLGRDRERPKVSSTIPIDGAENVSRDSLVQATFSEPMNSATVNQNTFVVRKENESAIPGKVSLSPDAKTVSFDPDPNFDSKTKYHASVSTAVQDLAGNTLAEPKSWSFTTKDECETKPEPPVIAKGGADEKTGVREPPVIAKGGADEKTGAREPPNDIIE